MGMVGGAGGENDGTMCAWAGIGLLYEGLRENTQRGTGRVPPGEAEAFTWWWHLRSGQ